jgi:hypothetical protein
MEPTSESKDFSGFGPLQEKDSQRLESLKSAEQRLENRMHHIMEQLAPVSGVTADQVKNWVQAKNTLDTSADKSLRDTAAQQMTENPANQHCVEVINSVTELIFKSDIPQNGVQDTGWVAGHLRRSGTDEGWVRQQMFRDQFDLEGGLLRSSLVMDFIEEKMKKTPAEATIGATMNKITTQAKDAIDRYDRITSFGKYPEKYFD